jgi:hypothetical protein
MLVHPLSSRLRRRGFQPLIGITNEAVASLAGVDAEPGNGIQDAARSVIESNKFEDLGLDANFEDTLYEIADGNIDWGMSEASTQDRPPLSRSEQSQS